MGAQGVMDVYTTLDQVKAGVAALAAEPEDLYLEVEAAKPAATASAWYKADAKKHGYVNEPWYYGPVSRELAEDLAVRAAPGGFLVRVSTKRTKQVSFFFLVERTTYIFVVFARPPLITSVKTRGPV